MNDKIIVEVKPKERVENGIILPETHKTDLLEGKVLAIGEGYRLPDGTRSALTVKIGETVVFQPHVANEFEMDGQKRHILHESDVLCIIRLTDVQETVTSAI